MSDVRKNPLKSSQIIFRFSKNPGLRVASEGWCHNLLIEPSGAWQCRGEALQGAPAATSGPWGNPLGKSMGNERFAHKKVKKNWNIAHEKWKTRLYETNSKSWGNSLKKRATTVKLTIWSGRKNGLKRQQKELTQKKWEFQYRKPGWTNTISWETMEKLQKNVENEGTRRFN